jgi:hypothetical protein
MDSGFRNEDFLALFEKCVVHRPGVQKIKLEMGPEIFFGQPLSEIPPTPPFDKGEQVGFPAGPGS